MSEEEQTVSQENTQGKIKVSFHRVPVTTNVKLPVPSFDGNNIKFSSFYVGLTSLPIEMEWEGEYDPNTGTGLEGMQDALKTAMLMAFEATQEASREAWLRQREAAQGEAFDDQRMKAFAYKVRDLLKAEMAEELKQAVIAEMMATERQLLQEGDDDNGY